MPSVGVLAAVSLLFAVAHGQWAAVFEPASCPADCTDCGQLPAALPAIEAASQWLLDCADSTVPNAFSTKAPAAFWRQLGPGEVSCQGDRNAAVALEHGISTSALGPTLFVQCAGSTKAAKLAQEVFRFVGQSGVGSGPLRANGDPWVYSSDGVVGFPNRSTEGYTFGLVANEAQFDGTLFPTGAPTLRSTAHIAWGLLRYGLESPGFASLSSVLALVASTVITAKTASRGTLIVPEQPVPRSQAPTLALEMTVESAAVLCAISRNVDSAWDPVVYSGLLAGWTRTLCEGVTTKGICPFFENHSFVPAALGLGPDGTLNATDRSFDARTNILYAGALVPSNGAGGGADPLLLCGSDAGTVGVALLRSVLTRRGVNRTAPADPLTARFVSGPSGGIDAELSIMALMAARALRPPPQGDAERDRQRMVASLADAAVARACLRNSLEATATLSELSPPSQPVCSASGLWGSSAATALAIGLLADENYFKLPKGPVAPPPPSTTAPAPTTPTAPGTTAPPAPTTTTATPTSSAPTTTATPTGSTSTTSAPTTTMMTTTAMTTTGPTPTTTASGPTTTGVPTPPPTTTGAPTPTTTGAPTPTTTGAPTPPATTSNATSPPPEPDHDNPEERRDQIVIWSIVGAAAALLVGTVGGMLLRNHLVKRSGERQEASHLLQAGTQPSPIGFF